MREPVKVKYQFFRSLEVHITDHCNLECAGCFHFAPLAEPKYYDYDEIKEGLLKVKKIVGDRPMSIHILGGEPLLHPRCLDFCKLTAEIFPRGKHFLITNGILLKDQPQEFFDTINEIGFTVQWSQYGQKDSELENLVRTKFIRHWVYNHEAMSLKYVNLKYPQPIKDVYPYCLAGVVPQLKGNYIYKCHFSAGIEFLMKYHNLEYPADYNDDLNKVCLDNLTLEQLDQFIVDPSDYCKYCAVTGVENFPYSERGHLSEHKKEEGLYPDGPIKNSNS